MTSRDTTGFLARRESKDARLFSEKLLVVAWGAIQWPWLLRSLHGGRKAEKAALLAELDLPSDALPNLGSWKADTVFLRHIVDTIAALRPRNVVELGCGASTLIIARALQRHGGGRLVSYDQHADFCRATGQWLAEHGLDAQIIHAPLVERRSRWSSQWYDLSQVPAEIDLLVVDGPPWALNPFVRGNCEALFSRIIPGGMVLLDDAARPGERVVKNRWREAWPGFGFRLDARGAKGTLIGRKR
jgi:predicted O-methyltransferase YrrM